MTTDEKLAGIRARLAKATPGPWQITGTKEHHEKDNRYFKVRGTRLGAKWHIADVRYLEMDNYSEHGEAQSIADLIAHAPEDLAWLLGEIERLRGLNTELIRLSKTKKSIAPNPRQNLAG